MGMFRIFDIAGSGMSAQTIRLNTVASNMANADTVSGSREDAYRARQPVFAAVLQASGGTQGKATVPVQVTDVVESQMPVNRVYMPQNAEADAEGYVYQSNVSVVEEMANMISASRSYQTNAEIANTSKQLMLDTLKLGQ